MVFIWLITRERLPVIAADFIMEHIKNKYVFLLAINIFLLLVGCVMDIVSAIIVISPILAVALLKYDINLIHYGIMMIVNIELGFLTFPFGLNLFVSMGITGKSNLYWKGGYAIFDFDDRRFTVDHLHPRNISLFT